MLLKLMKTIENRIDHQFIQILELLNSTICPVRAIRALLVSRRLHSNAPLFADKTYPHLPVIDTKFRDALRSVLQMLGIPTSTHGFHAFRRSGATLAFDNGIHLEHIMSHGLWRNSAV